MFFYLALVLCTYNQIAVEFGRKVVTRVSIDLKRIKQTTHDKTALHFNDGVLKLTKEITPSSIYNIHLFVENFFDLDQQSYVHTKENPLEDNSLQEKIHYFSSIEEKINTNALASLYFDTLLNKTYSLKKGTAIVVSSRDYFTKAQSKNLCEIFSAFGNKVTGIPESLAACIQNVEFKKTGSKNYYLNFKGSKVVGSLYEVNIEDKTTSITLLETKEIDMKSDYDFENLAATNITEQLKARENVSFLPYEDPRSFPYYANIQNNVFEYLRDLSSLSFYKILEVNFYDKKTNVKMGSFSDKNVSYDAFKEQISNDMDKLKELIASIPEDANKFIITDIPFRTTLTKDFSLVLWESIAKGLLLAHDSKFKLTDTRILSSTTTTHPVYFFVKKEVSLKEEVKNTIIPAINVNLQEFKFVTEEEKTSLFSLVQKNFNEFTVQQLKEIKRMWEAIRKLNVKREAENICREDDIKKLESVIEEAEELIKTATPEETKDLNVILEDTKKWFEESKDNTEAKGFLSKSNVLSAHVNYIKKKINKAKEKEEEEKRREAEEKRKEEKRLNNEESTVVEQALDNELPQNDDLTGGEQLLETDAPPKEVPIIEEQKDKNEEKKSNGLDKNKNKEIPSEEPPVDKTIKKLKDKKQVYEEQDKTVDSAKKFFGKKVKDISNESANRDTSDSFKYENL